MVVLSIFLEEKAMTLTEAAMKRKSIRSYHMDELGEDVIEDIVDFISDLEVPFASIDWNFDILPFEDMCRLVGGVPVLHAPHYLVIRSEKIKGCLQNAGYLGEMAILYMTSRGIASCWQGGLEAENDFPDCLPYITAVAFGMSDEPFRADGEEIKRKGINSIAAGDLKGDLGKMIECARIAPTFMAKQPCRFTALNSRIHVYRIKGLIRIPHITWQQCIDVGVALAHIDAVAKELDYSIKVEIQDPPPEWNKNVYQCTIHTSKNED